MTADAALDVPAADRIVESARVATLLAGRLKDRQLRLSFGFIRSEDKEAAPAPLATIIGAGRGTDARLKLMLALIWAAGGGDERHRTGAFPLSAWAKLLGIYHGHGRGERRVRDAARFLESRKLIRVHAQAGRQTFYSLLADNGSGAEYHDPKGLDKRKSNTERLFVAFPPEFLTEGWLATLSARAIAVYLILAEMTISGDWKWVSPSVAEWRYRISPDTRTRGLRELRGHKLVEVRRRPVSDNDFLARRRRNTYRLARAETDKRPLSFPARSEAPSA